MRVWGPRRREVTATVKASRAGLWTLRFSPDGRRLAVAGGAGHVSVWRAGARLRRQATLAGHVNVVTSLALHSRRTTAGVGQRRGRDPGLGPRARGRPAHPPRLRVDRCTRLQPGRTAARVRWDRGPRAAVGSARRGLCGSVRLGGSITNSTSARVPRRACGRRALAAARARWTSIRSLSVVGSARFRIGPDAPGMAHVHARSPVPAALQTLSAASSASGLLRVVTAFR